MNQLFSLTKNKNFTPKLILILLLLILPWMVNNSSDELKAQEITDDLSFYQINLSFLRYLIKQTLHVQQLLRH